ncbi:MAG: glycosyltransferase 87 family protein [Anaerolineae bacterium]
MRNPLWTWGWLLLLVALTLLLRLPYFPLAGHEYDLGQIASWGEGIVQQGLFGVYYNVPSCNYPPIYIVMLGVAALLWHNTPFVIPLLKLFPVLCETLLIIAVAVWVGRDKGWTWLIPLCLALNPGLIGTTALWGQADSVMTLFLVLALLALNRDKRYWTGVAYALALLTKFQAIVLLPLLVLLILRRYGWRALLINAGIVAGIMAAVLAPFIAGSGWEAAMRHYVSAWYPYPTVMNAFNIWYWITPPPVGDLWTIPHGSTQDIATFWSSLSYRNLGLALVSLYTLVICVSMWRQYQQKREFLWAAALYMGFFMLATKMHERYVYPAVIFSIVAVAQDRRVWFAAFGLSFTYLYNIVYTLDTHFVWLGLPLLRLLPGTLLNAVILVNVALLLEFARVLFNQTRIRMVNAGARALVIITAAVMVLITLNPPHSALPEGAVPVKMQFGSGISLEGYFRSANGLTLYWWVLDEIPQGDYHVQPAETSAGTRTLSLDEALQVGNLPPHMSWFGRQLIVSYPLMVRWTFALFIEVRVQR